MPSFQLPIMRRRRSILAVFTAGFLLAVAPVLAQGGTSEPGASGVDRHLESVPPTASIDQYVEDVPTSSGSSVPGVTNETRAPQPQSTADALDTVAESSAYGAPKRGVVPGRPLDVSPTTSVSAALRSTVGALGTATDARLLGLLFVVLATTVGAVALGLRRAQS